MSRFDGNIVVGTSVDVGGINTGLNKITGAFNKLAKHISNGPLTQLFSSAASAASDLVEVQNVVDVSFEDMSYKAELFAKNSIQQFGMSELAAKRTASSFMAMGKAADIGMENASNMAVNLAALTGDFASFYNISQDYARVALSAVYTGETETLKRYGIILTEANLQQYANTKGIEKNVKVMSAREKLILRYMYVMDKTQDMQGDFVRTQDSFANQTRLLGQAWNQFLIILGHGVTTVLSPLLKILGQLIIKLQQFTSIVLSIIGNIFGLDLTRAAESIDGYTGAVEGAIDAEDELADSIGKSAKAAMKAIAPFDELNVIRTPSSSGKGGGADIFGDFEAGLLYDWPSVTEEVFKSTIDNFYDFGRWLSDGFKDILDKIPWDAIFGTARTFGKNFSDFLNGLINPETFTSLGVTISNIFNTILYSIQEFANNFDWSQTGEAIGNFVNALFSTFDWENASDTINSIKDGLKTMFSKAVETIEWEDIRDQIADFLANLDWEVKFAAIAPILAAAFAVLLTKAVLGGLKMLTGKIGSSIVSRIFEILIPDTASLTAILSSLSTILGSIAGVFLTISGFIGTIVSGVSLIVGDFKWLKVVLLAISVTLAGIGAAILIIVNSILLIPAAILFLFAQVFAVNALFIAAVKLAITTISDFIKEHWEAITNIVTTFYSTYFKPVVDAITNTISTLWYYISSVARALWIILKAGLVITFNFYKDIFTAIGDFIYDKFEYVKNLFTTLIESLRTILTYFYDKYLREFVETKVFPFLEKIAAWVKEHVIEPIKKIFKAFWQGIIGQAITQLNMVIETVEDLLSSIIDGINVFLGFINKVAASAAKITGDTWTDIVLLQDVELKRIPIPKLAQGGVIPPNAPFLAMLGDQKNGTNIEAPLDTIKQALQEALASSGFGGSGDITIPISIDGREIARAVVKQNELNKRITGRSLI